MLDAMHDWSSSASRWVRIVGIFRDTKSRSLAGIIFGGTQKDKRRRRKGKRRERRIENVEGKKKYEAKKEGYRERKQKEIVRRRGVQKEGKAKKEG